MVSTLSIALLAILAFGATSLRAQGVELEKTSIVLCGSSSNCTRPATVDYEKLRNATPEWQTIRSDGVRQGSARYALLMARIGQRIASAANAVAADKGHDLVVRAGDIADQRGQTVVDITDQVLAELGSL